MRALTRSIVLLQLLALVSGLTLSPLTADADEAVDDGQPLFLPLPPDVPRFQFLTKYSSALDVSTKKRGFRDFVFGGEDKEAQLVQKPYGLAVYEGAIYVVDTRGNGYGIFDLGKGRSKIVQPTGAGALVSRAMASRAESRSARTRSSTIGSAVSRPTTPKGAAVYSTSFS